MSELTLVRDRNRFGRTFWAWSARLDRTSQRRANCLGSHKYSIYDHAIGVTGNFLLVLLVHLTPFNVAFGVIELSQSDQMKPYTNPNPDAASSRFTTTEIVGLVVAGK